MGGDVLSNTPASMRSEPCMRPRVIEEAQAEQSRVLQARLEEHKRAADEAAAQAAAACQGPASGVGREGGAGIYMQEVAVMKHLQCFR